MKKTTLGCLLAALWAGLAAGAGSEDTDKKPVPLYTNDDLRRVSPHRDETGVNSRPAAAVPPAPAPAGTAAKGRVRAVRDITSADSAQTAPSEAATAP